MDKPTQNGGDSDQDFDPSAEMLVNDFDDEHTLEEEEAMESAESVVNELDDLQKEGDMPLEDLLALYGYNGNSNKNKSPKETKSASSINAMETPAASTLREVPATATAVTETVLPAAPANPPPPIVATPLPPPPPVAVPAAPPPVTIIAPPPAKPPPPKLSPEKSIMETTPTPVTSSPSRHHLLRCKSVSQPSEESSGSESDDEGSPDDDWRKMIQVGSDFQALVPEGLSRYDGAPAYENEDRLLWDPSKLTNDEVEEYLRQAQLAHSGGTPGLHSIPTGSHIRDDEQALYLLLQCGHNIEEALRRRRMQPTFPTDTMSLWSEEECRSFENGLRTYGKDFHLIQQNKVRTRSVGELVQFYYLWKKTERHDVFASKTRLEKKKYALHPGTTDYMDRFLDEQENPSNHRDRSSSPSIQSIIFGEARKPALGRTVQNKAETETTSSSTTTSNPTATTTTATSVQLSHAPTALVVNSSDKSLVNGVDRHLSNTDGVGLSRNGGQNYEMTQDSSGSKMTSVVSRPPPVWSEMYNSASVMPPAVVSTTENNLVGVSVQEKLVISGK